MWCDLGFVKNSRGNKAAVNLRPTGVEVHIVTLLLQACVPLRIDRTDGGLCLTKK